MNAQVKHWIVLYWFAAVLLWPTGCTLITTDNLNQAISQGSIQQVEHAVNAGADVNGKGMHEMTPLMVAAKDGRLDVSKFLIAHGADINGHNQSGDVLMWAVNSRNEALVQLLLNAGVDKSWSNSVGDTATNLAEHLGLTRIELLLQN